ncbi:MAG: UPF0149 family protein [Firmicutes bacterium]|nr:UPF0149 family protein [Bacillota bacterium]
MTKTPSKLFDQLNRQLHEQEIIVSAAEVHGMLTGLVASCKPSEQREWLVVLADLINEGQKFADSMIASLEQLHEFTVEGLRCPDLSFQMVLPSDDEPLADRLTSLTEWAQCFLVGFGIHQQNLAKASPDLQEAIQDMAEISRLSTDVVANDEDERAFYEVSEYVRITAIMCFNELSEQPIAKVPENSTLH